MKQEQPWRGARPKKRSNGNPVYYEESKSFRSMVWDEENRLRGINDNGKLHLYTYDHTGERAVKSSGESSTVVTNGLTSAVITHMDDYTAYVNPYFVVQKGKFTKHYFEGSSRIVSKLGEGTFVHKNTGIMAGGIDYIRQNAQMQEARDNYIRGLKVPPGPPTQHGIYASPEWTGQPYPSLGWQNIRQDQEPPEGWPRPPKFNEPGDVPGPPVQYGDPITPQTVKAGYGFVPNGIREKNLYFYHPDHLGSSSYITDREGRITQHTEYIAFGEVLFEEHSTSKTMPYLFNGKELDSETNLTYFGARYLDMKTSLWLNTDPLSGYNPIKEHEHYIDGQHNGGVFNPMNLNTYGYTYQNPIRYIDPNGKQADVTINKANKNIIIAQKFIFYGTEANPSLSSRIANEISYQFNNYGGTVKYNGTNGWKVKFQISYETLSVSQAQNLARDNTDRKLNFIRIEKNTNRHGRSFMNAIGSNSGHWLVSDGLGESSTAPHENAHGLGLYHISDQRGEGIPNIMAARGSLVDPQYQYDSKAPAGTKGGSVNPIHRRVRNTDIQGIINNIKTDNNGTNYIGTPKIDNTILDKFGDSM